MKKLSKQILKFGILLVLMASLMVGAVVPASAAPPITQPSQATGMHTLEGKVNSVSGSSFVIQNGNQNPVTIATDGNTMYFVIPMGKAQNYVNSAIARDNREDRREQAPKQSRAAQLKELRIPANWRTNLGWLEIFDRKGALSDIAPGDRVIVRAQTADNLAKQVIIIKGPVDKTVRGTISAFAGNQITIASVANNVTTSTTVNVTASTRIVLKGLTVIQTGEYAVAVYNSAHNNDALTINIQAAAPTTVAPVAPSASAALNSISIYPSPATISAGSTLQFTVTAAYANGVTADVTRQSIWQTNAPGIAAISSTGLATGIVHGTATITATVNGKSTSAIVTVP